MLPMTPVVIHCLRHRFGSRLVTSGQSQGSLFDLSPPSLSLVALNPRSTLLRKGECQDHFVVKEGKKKASTEIELKAPNNKPNLVVCRELTFGKNTSSFWIDGELSFFELCFQWPASSRFCGRMLLLLFSLGPLSSNQTGPSPPPFLVRRSTLSKSRSGTSGSSPFLLFSIRLFVASQADPVPPCFFTAFMPSEGVSQFTEMSPPELL